MAHVGRKRNTAPITLPVVSGWTDATPERLSIARRDGLETEAVEHLTPSGFKTGTKHRAIQDPIDLAHRRGTIDAAERTAGAKFMAHLHKANIEGAMTIDLSAGGTFGTVTKSMSHTRIENLRRVVEASKSLDPRWREPWLNWCREVLIGRAGAQRLGEMALGEGGSNRCRATAIVWGNRVLKSCLSDLSRYYSC